MQRVWKGEDVQNRVGQNGKIQCTSPIIQETAKVQFFSQEDELKALDLLNGLEVEGQKLTVKV